MEYKGHSFLYEMNIDVRRITLIHNPSGVTLQAPIGVFFSQSDIEQTLDELIEKAELMVIRNDDSFFS